MNYSVVSERREWLEIGCSLMTCTILTNASAISTNTLTDMESTGRRESGGTRRLSGTGAEAVGRKDWKQRPHPGVGVRLAHSYFSAIGEGAQSEGWRWEGQACPTSLGAKPSSPGKGPSGSERGPRVDPLVTHHPLPPQMQ